MRMRWLWVPAGMLALAACGTLGGTTVDLPRQKVGGGMDDRQRSPCACVELPLLRTPSGVDPAALSG